ncbi:MAG: DUF2227 family putative metal-binding protein [Chlamydiia bacterium]|nr:DUF2227 family putative metal-binding protein [Chlamydiia bacterium]MCP5509865.1 DUF2227 family putative metal-binding protein [Chlamydiales bacterium]
MSQYKTHAKFNLFLALPVLVGAIYYLFHPYWTLLALFSFAFAYSTLFMSPDMDLAHQIKFFSLRGLLTSPFRLYSRIFRHRGLSHSILFGTLTRIGFLSLLALAGLWIYSQAFPSPNSFLVFLKSNQIPIIYAFAGIFCADLCHLLLDI